MNLGDLQKKVLQLEAVNSELEAQSRERGKHQGSIEDELMKTRLERKNLEVEVGSARRHSATTPHAFLKYCIQLRSQYTTRM